MSTFDDEKEDARHTRVNRFSTAVLVVALCIGGYVAYSARPWEQPRTASGPIGLVGAASGAPHPGDAAPDFTLIRADGSTLQLSELRGQPVFLNFWATWCAFCKQEMPDMQRIFAQFDGRLVVLGVNAGDSIESGAGFAKRIGVTYELVYDTEQLVVAGYQVRSMPTSYFIDASGRIVDAHFGFLSYEDMLAKVMPLLDSTGDVRP